LFDAKQRRAHGEPYQGSHTIGDGWEGVLDTRMSLQQWHVWVWNNIMILSISRALSTLMSRLHCGDEAFRDQQCDASVVKQDLSAHWWEP
jgi:predicted solute-binding protein